MTKDKRQILTVAEVNAQAKEVLEHFQVWVKGEVSEFKRSDAWVYNYLTLKDESAQIRGIVSNRVLAAMDFDLQDGQEVVVFGRLSVYERRGDYQIKIEKIEELGKGSLQEQLEKLKAKLQAEGLFAEEIKKPLPAFPEKIGVVSSQDGAAFKDFRKIIKARFPGVQILLKDVLVQGDSSPGQVATAVAELDKNNLVDVIVVTRGGGSLEDLWGFNDESVARAIFAAKTPVVSAIGHEKDVTICDLVADHRSSTPSNAAEEIVPDQEELFRQLDDFASRIKQVRERWQDFPQEIDQLLAGIKSGYRRFVKDRALSTELLYRKVLALSPEKVLARGYSVLSRQGKIVRAADKVKVGDNLKAKLAKGGLFVTVKGKSKK